MNKCVKYVSILIILIGFAAVATAQPASVEGLHNTTYEESHITWVWADPGDANFVVMVYIDGAFEENVSKGTETYDATGFTAGTSHTISTRTANGSGINTAWINDTATTKSSSSTPPPASVEGLHNTTYEESHITWVWADPGDANFVVMVYIDGAFKENVSEGTEAYDAAGFTAGTSHTISTRTANGSSINTAWMNDTATTKSSSSTPPPASITNLQNTTGEANIKWTWTDPGDADFVVMVYIDGAFKENVSEGTEAYDATGFTAGTSHTISTRTANGSGINTAWINDTATTKSLGHSTGFRIWDANRDPKMDLNYTWDARSYTGFYYDIDDDISTETLTVQLEDYDDRTIKEDNLKYITTAGDLEFECTEWGTYKVIGFMAEKYFAGYEEDNTSITNENIRLLSKDMLSKVLIDEDEKHMIATGASLELKEGYELKIIQLDTDGGQAQIELMKNGKSVDTDIVESPDDYVYEKDLGKLDDVPLVVVHINSVFAGTESDMLSIEGIFQISDDTIPIDTGEEYDEMEIKSSSGYTIEMRNMDDIDLEVDEIVDIMGNLKFLVADNNTLRFALYEDITSEPGTHDIRGTVYNTNEPPNEWDHMNFEGFYYNIDDDLGTETLTVKKCSGNNIPEDALVYTTTAQLVEFDFNDWGYFNVVGFMAESYFAGYEKDETNKDVTNENVNLLSKDMLSKVLIDVEDDRMISTGASLQLEEGYELKVIQLDTDGGQAQLELMKNGKSVDTEIVSSPDTYVYEKDLGKLDDVPIIVVYIGNVFAGTESDMVTIEGAFQISDDPISIDTGDEYGEMEITKASGDTIEMKNSENDIDLDEGEKTMIMENVGFMTSDDGGDRYVLFVRRTIGSPAALAIDFSETPVVDEVITITVTSDGDPVEGAAVTFGGENLGITDSNGEVTVTSEESGTFTVMASKEDYQSATEDLKILTEGEAEEDQLAIEMPGEVNPGDDVIIKVTSDGDSVEGASVKWDTEDIGETDETGSLTYTADEPGTYTVVASKSGYLDASEKITVSRPSAKFELSNFVLPEEVSAGKKFTVSVDVTNNGEVNGTYTAELSANGSVVDSKDIALDPDETGTVEFTHQVAEAGTCTIEIGTESGEIVVTKKAKSNTAAVVAILIVLALLGAIGYVLISSTPEGGWTIEKLIEAIKEKFQRKGL